ncbi:unnamed protein product [Moneuplotes crassus]|uniref:Uncharacterized protein n=1 Tax=Euplotes crassus TaxID=5936 RepID=A0AAD1Y8P7_EUPCR|nr:unnamed protein product [Moneuplotes crassus]
MTGKERKTLIMHKRMEIKEKKDRIRSREIDKEIEEEIQQMNALKTLVMTRKFSYLQLLKIDHLERANKLRRSKKRIKNLKNAAPFTHHLQLPPVKNNLKTARIISQPKSKKQEDLVESYKRLKYLEKFDRKEEDESSLIEKGQAVQIDYKTQGVGPKMFKNNRYQSKKNMHRMNRFSNKNL